MPASNHKIQERLSTAQVALSNALSNSGIQAALAAYGCTVDRLQEGQALYERALALQLQQGVAYGDLSTANAALAAAEVQAHADYMRYVKVARVAFETDPGVLTKLKLGGGRKKARAGWLLQAKQFYSNALSDPDIISRLGAYSLTQDMLEAGKRRVAAVDASYAARSNHEGEAKKATKVRDEALAALDEWMSEFRQIARMALKRQPQDLKKLGVPSRARKTSSATTGASSAPIFSGSPTELV